MPRTQVDAALTIATSDLAKAATARYDLTLDQATVIDEFDDEPLTVKALLAAAQTGQFAHVAQRARDDGAAAAALAARQPGPGRDRSHRHHPRRGHERHPAVDAPDRRRRRP